LGGDERRVVGQMDNHAGFQAVCVEADNGFVGGLLCFVERTPDETQKGRGSDAPRPGFDVDG
jgi:hypothetical protein